MENSTVARIKGYAFSYIFYPFNLYVFCAEIACILSQETNTYRKKQQQQQKQVTHIKVFLLLALARVKEVGMNWKVYCKSL